jgi:hypothetical protein
MWWYMVMGLSRETLRVTSAPPRGRQLCRPRVRALASTVGVAHNGTVTTNHGDSQILKSTGRW